jgi:hypothetical protein
MGTTENFRKQHADIVVLVEKIKAGLLPARLAAEAGATRRDLSTLMGKLTLHFAMEDNALYPRLEKHARSDVRETAATFMSEMSGIKPQLEAFAKKWSEPAIRGDAEAFCAEARKLFVALGDRIQRENTVLYAMVDKLG